MLARFLKLYEQVQQFVDRYVDVLVQQADDLDEFRLKRLAGRIAESITFLDRAISQLLKSSEEAQTGPQEDDRAKLAEYSDRLRRIQASLKELGEGAPIAGGTSVSLDTSFRQLRNLTEEAWSATAGIFAMASAIITELLDRMPRWTQASASLSEVSAANPRDTNSEYAMRVTVNR